MPRLVKERQHYYTNISNLLSRDKHLSFKARGLFLYMWSQADNWQFYVSELVNHSDKDGREAVQNGIKELEKYGYLKRVDRRNGGGNFDGKDWILTDEPDNSPSNGFPVGRVSRRTDNPSLRNNNSKNYQYKNIDDVKGQPEINYFYEKFLNQTWLTGVPYEEDIEPTQRQGAAIKKLIGKLPSSCLEEVAKSFKKSMTDGMIMKPWSYLIKVLSNEVENQNE